MKPLTGLPVDVFVQVSGEFNIPLKDLLEFVQQVENGASAAFLARYRADLCGGLDEQRVHSVLRTLKEHQDLIDHRISMLATLGQRGVLTPELKQQLEQAGDRTELNDIFAPYRPRRREAADEAIEKGLDPLARMLWFQQDGLDIPDETDKHVDPEKGVESAEQALDGAYAIASRWLSDKPEILRELRRLCRRDCEIVLATKPAARKEPRYSALDGFRAKASEIGWQKLLSIRRGMRTGLLQASTEFPLEAATQYLERCLLKDAESGYAPHLRQVVAAALRNGLAERVKKDVLRKLDEQADSRAVDSYCKVLRDALLAPVAHGLTIVGIETGRHGGWRAALIDGKGDLIDCAIVRQGEAEAGSRSEPPPERSVPQDRQPVVADLQAPAPVTSAPPVADSGEAPPAAAPADPVQASPVPEPTENPPSGAPASDGTPAAEDPAPEPATTAKEAGPKGDGTGEAKATERVRLQVRHAELSEILTAHDVDLIVFPSGPRQRSTEKFLRSQIRKSGKSGIAWRAMRDSGTWIYATSKTAKREFPRLEPALRSAASLARRAQDSMAELVKSDPRTVGIGSHHHEVNAEQLREALSITVQRAVHDVGVDANRASVALLSLVPGFTERLAKRVVEHRRKNGAFRFRTDLLKVDGLSERIFAQSVGFLRVYGGDPLDGTGAHPEYRELHEGFAEAAGCDVATLLAEPERLEEINPEQFATPERSVVFVRSALDEFKPARRNLRGEFQLPKPAVPLRTDEELVPGCKISGVVASIADFGAFLDIGADQDALLHISQISREHMRESKPSLQVGDSVEVFIKAADQSSRRIGLTMWEPRSRPPRDRNGARPPRMPRTDGGERRRGGRGSDGSDRRRPFVRSFGPDSERRQKGGRSKMSMEEKLGMLQDKYRTKV